MTRCFEAVGRKACFNLINLIWYLKWTSRYGGPSLTDRVCQHVQENPYLTVPLRHENSQLPSKFKALTRAPTQDCSFHCRKWKGNYLWAQGTQGNTQLSRLCVQITKNSPQVSAIHSTLIRFQHDYLLSVTNMCWITYCNSWAHWSRWRNGSFCFVLSASFSEQSHVRVSNAAFCCAWHVNLHINYPEEMLNPEK